MNEGPAPHTPPAGWQYRPEDTNPNTPPGGAQQPSTPVAAPEITWTASEYIAHHKDVGWYVGLLAVTTIIASLMYFLTHDRISTVSIVIISLLFAVAAARKPRVLTYALSREGIAIGDRFHSFSEYRSFTVRREGVFANIELVPMQRFMPLTSMYCSPENEERILTFLSQYVPYEKPTNTMADSLARKIRF